MNRAELTNFLKDVLHVCGESIIMEMVWLEKIAEDGLEQKYQLVIKSSYDLPSQQCLKPIIKKYGLKLTKQGSFWVISELRES